MIAGPVT